MSNTQICVDIFRHFFINMTMGNFACGIVVAVMYVLIKIIVFGGLSCLQQI